MDNITISMEEYKELLIIKGRYEELKTKYTKLVVDKPNNIIGDANNIPITPYKITCRAECTD